MRERRKTLRAQTCLPGHAAFQRGSSAVECLVQALSASGARVHFPADVTAPRYFDLFIGQSGGPYRARVMWRHAREVGVTFLEGRTAPEVLLG